MPLGKIYSLLSSSKNAMDEKKIDSFLNALEKDKYIYFGTPSQR